MITNRWVVVATERSKRPSDFSKAGGSGNKKCPFCPGNEEETPVEIAAFKRNGAWHIRVVGNKFAAFHREGNEPPVKKRIGVFRAMEGRGAHEVIISTPDHNKRIYDFSSEEMYELLWMCKERTLDLAKDQWIESVLIFGNEGESAGASLEHEHWQLVGLPIMPKRIQDEIDSCQKHYDIEDTCAFCDLNRQELGDKIRVVSANDVFFSLSYWTARFPFETWILPVTHRPLFEDGGEKFMRPLAEITTETIKRIGAVLNRPDFNIYFHSAPLHNREHDRYFHFHIEILPMVTKAAGFEWGSGFHIDPISPEDAAEYLRNAKI